MPWEYCWWSSKSSLLSIKRLGAWRWQIRNNDARWASVHFEAHIYREFIRVQWRADLLGRPVKQNSAVRTSSVNVHCELHREVCCVHRKMCRPYVLFSLLRWDGSIPAKIRNINQKIPVSVILAIPQLQITAHITKIYETAMQQWLRFSFPSCLGGGQKASEWTEGPQPRLDLRVGRTIAFCLLRGQGGGGPGGGPGGGTTSRGGERVRSRFRFLLRSLCSSILQRCLSIGNCISYIITKDVWYGILCHGLSLCAHSDCATLVIYKNRLAFMKVTISKQWRAVGFCSFWGAYLPRVCPRRSLLLGRPVNFLFTKRSCLNEFSQFIAHGQSNCELHREVPPCPCQLFTMTCIDTRFNPKYRPGKPVYTQWYTSLSHGCAHTRANTINNLCDMIQSVALSRSISARNSVHDW